MFSEILLRRRERKARAAESLRTDDRRSFMKSVGVAAAGAALAGTMGSRPAQAANLDVAILQFALNLEYLEAEFYSRAAYGFGLGPADTGNSVSTVTGGSQVPFTDRYATAIAREIATEETKHVRFLRAALGAAAVNEPVIDLKNSFIALGQLAGLSNNFNPFADELSFFLGAYIFEDVGVSAYHGAAPLITDKNYLDKAAGILAVEAYHAGLIRLILFQRDQGPATAAISKVRSQLDGTENRSTLDDEGVGNTGNPHIVLCSDEHNGTLLGGYPNPPPGNNAIAYDRTPRQVLNIVYGGVNATHGLFFPNGLNGTITS